MRLLPKATALLLLLPPLLFFAPRAAACMCGQRQPCEAYAGAGLVFVGLVTSKGTAPPGNRLPQNAVSSTPTRGALAAHFSVEEVFLGAPGEEVAVTGEGTTCDYDFVVGERYLVYAYAGPDGAVRTNACSGTAPLSRVGEHLYYLRVEARTSPRTTFTGYVRRASYDVLKNVWNEEPAPGVEVILESEGRGFRSTSDAQGEFVLRGLPRGRYRVRTEPAANFSSVEIMAKEPRAVWELDVPGRGCVTEWFEFRPRGELSGQVSFGGGRPGGDLRVELVFADRPDTRGKDLESAAVGPDGAFKFTFLPPGKYLLGFNLSAGPTLDHPLPEFYYPGVVGREGATVLEVGEGAAVGGLKLPAPERLPERAVEGVAVWPDGSPAAAVSVQLHNARRDWLEGNPVLTDSQGRFSMRGVEGQTYRLSALVNRGVSLVHSKALLVKVERVNPPVRLVIELP